MAKEKQLLSAYKGNIQHSLILLFSLNWSLAYILALISYWSYILWIRMWNLFIKHFNHNEL